MDAPNKTYKDYKSQENIYNIGAKVMRLVGLERGGKDDRNNRLWFWKSSRLLLLFIKI